jgi:hypothetical protein
MGTLIKKAITDRVYFISLIPFVRNLIAYTEGNKSDNYETLTSCLHLKPHTCNITAEQICSLYKNTYCRFKNFKIDYGSYKMVTLIYEVADSLENKEDIDEIEIGNKIVLSIAIRLRVEEFLKGKLESGGYFSYSNRDQTRDLSRSYKEHFPEDNRILQVLERVNLMTPENIHVNAFMYEPLIDMSVNHLIDLYKDVKSLS